MTGRNWFALGLAVVAFAAAFPARAQEQRFEIGVGPRLNLVSEKVELEDQKFGGSVRLGVHIGSKVTLSALYELTSSRSDLPDRPDGPVDLALYGLNGTFYMAGDEDFRLLGTVSVGRGSFDFDPVAGLSEADNRSTDIFLWYEAGVGCELAFGKRWALRIQLTGRRFRPDEPTAILPNTGFSLVPGADLVFRF